MARNDDVKVSVGDRFYRVGQFSSVWVVKQLLFSDNQSIPHAVIEKLGFAGDADVIPLYVLEDPSNYRQDRRSLEPAVPPRQRRRATDKQSETA